MGRPSRLAAVALMRQGSQNRRGVPVDYVQAEQAARCPSMPMRRDTWRVLGMAGVRVLIAHADARAEVERIMSGEVDPSMLAFALPTD